MEREVSIPPHQGTIRERAEWTGTEEEPSDPTEIFYTLAPWYGFKKAACSLTFDDGTMDHYVLAFPELQRRNLKATFFLITRYRKRGYWKDGEKKRRLFSWDQARQIRKAGHEIGSHSRTHADLTAKDAFARREIAGSFTTLRREIRPL